MSDSITSTIRLSKTDALNFANSLFRPTSQEIAVQRKQLNRINQNITIRRKAEGFEADIADLDLSFLEKTTLETVFNVEITVKIKSTDKEYCDSKSPNSKETIVIKTDSQYTSSKDNSFSPLAA